MNTPIILATNSVNPHQNTDHTLWFSFPGFGWSLVFKRKAIEKSRSSEGKYYWGKKSFMLVQLKTKFIPFLSIFSHQPPISVFHLLSPSCYKVFLKSYLPSRLCYVSFPKTFCVWIPLVHYNCLNEAAHLSWPRPCLLTWSGEVGKFIIL